MAAEDTPKDPFTNTVSRNYCWTPLAVALECDPDFEKVKPSAAKMNWMLKRAAWLRWVAPKHRAGGGS
jgi:hypothetical protein